MKPLNSANKSQLNNGVPSRQQVESNVDTLVQEYRLRCLWFTSPDYLPATDEERLRALNNIERHGDCQAFMRARELKEWLLQISN